MPELTLHPVFDVSGLIHYALAERAGRHLADIQTYALIDGRLYFQWPAELDQIQRRTSHHRSCAYLLGFCHAVPADIVEHGTEAVEAYVAERVRKRRARVEKVRAMRTKDYLRKKEK